MLLSVPEWRDHRVADGLAVVQDNPEGSPARDHPGVHIRHPHGGNSYRVRAFCTMTMLPVWNRLPVGQPVRLRPELFPNCVKDWWHAGEVFL